MLDHFLSLMKLLLEVRREHRLIRWFQKRRRLKVFEQFSGHTQFGHGGLSPCEHFEHPNHAAIDVFDFANIPSGRDFIFRDKRIDRKNMAVHYIELSPTLLLLLVVVLVVLEMSEMFRCR